MLFATGIEHRPGPTVAASLAIGYGLLNSIRDTFLQKPTTDTLTREDADGRFFLEVGNITNARTHAHDLATRDADAFLLQEHSLALKDVAAVKDIINPFLKLINPP